VWKYRLKKIRKNNEKRNEMNGVHKNDRIKQLSEAKLRLRNVIWMENDSMQC